MIATKEKTVTVERTVKEGESFFVNGIEIRIQRKRGHVRQIRVRVRYPRKPTDAIDTAEESP